MDRIYSVSSLPSESVSGSASRSSSRSGGSWSQHLEVNRRHDSSSSPVCLECNIQAERITKALKEAIHKTKMAICIPELVSEYFFLNSILSESNMGDLLYIFELFEGLPFSRSVYSTTSINVDPAQTGSVLLKYRLQPELGHLIRIINNYPALEPKVNEMIEKMKAKRESQHSVKNRNAALEYLHCLEHFAELMAGQMNMSAAEKLALKFKQQSVEKSNNRYLKEIQAYNKALKYEEDTYAEQSRLKREKIMHLEQEFISLTAESAIKLKKQILDSERQMVLYSRAHAVRATAMKNELEESKAAFEALLEAHTNSEKAQRLRRFKVETQLQGWLQKYDLEMNDKQEELDEFTKLYEDELRLTTELEKKLLEQDLDYIPLMQEREEEYHREMLEKMTKFQMEHAARVIQNAWRKVLAHRQETKKLNHIQSKLKQQLQKLEP